MHLQNMIFGVFGGLGLFVFGMKYLSEGLQNVAGTKLRRVLRSLTQNRFRGIGLGTAVTCIVQSSSVTTIMLVGLLNAGIISLFQACSVVIGANIGTTITAQIIAFKVSQYALPAIGLGVAMMIIPRSRKTQFWGQILFALGIIFLGLSSMTSVMKPLKDVPAVMDYFVSLSGQPFMCVLIGVIFTVMVQSSSASIGMVIALANIGLINFETSLYLVLGDNVGTTITAWLASIGSSISARRMACFHTLFNIVGVAYFMFFVHIGLYPRFIDMITPGAITTDTIARHIANAHSLFNVFNALLFVGLITPIVSLTKKLIPGESMYVSTDFKYLQDKLLLTPEIAIESAKKELIAMANLVRKTTETAVKGFFAADKKSIPHVQTQESAVNQLQHDITFYLAKLSSQHLTPDLAEQMPPLLHSINDLERIADHAVNICELTSRIHADELKFSNKALAEMRTMYGKVEDMFTETLQSMEKGEKMSAQRVMLYEREVNEMQSDYRVEHTKRLCNKQCEPLSALIFMDMINNLEKIGDHLTNVAQACSRSYHFSQADNKY